ncbi:hypothetical protein KEM48_005581 [Puccinia striiformis f. sp. tritici PST-130]|nr:hypothetical protein H4Q26_005561 [Puccinia striiformis f. sp. tritici PST-130]KAI9615666.1 hypothetical protein KEM48_005581 [Puccinia striiformis f. sp. tritici PST-130]
MTSFDALMSLASKQTEASQIALVKETQIRQAREKVKRLEEERKEKERIRLEKERLAKNKLEDERREKQLIEERQRRIAERAIEQTRKQQDPDPNNRASGSRTNYKPSSTSSPRHRSTARPSSSIPANDIDPEEKRRLEREEKQAKARAKLFGEPISAHKKSTSTSRSSANASQRNNTSTAKGKAPMRGVAARISSKSVSGTATTFTPRQRIERTFSATERKPLNQTKRDRRTIEEVEQDMKRKKLEANTTAGGIKNLKISSIDSHFTDKRITIPLRPSASTSNLRDGNKSPRAGSEGLSVAKRKALNSLPTPSSKRTQLSTSLSKDNNNNRSSIGSSRPTTKSRPVPSSIRRQDATVSDDDDEDDDDSSSTDFVEDDLSDGHGNDNSVRDEIWKIMGKDRQKYTGNPIFSDEEDDMEADVDDVLEEEGRAAKLAKLEDQREQERLRQHEIEKKKRLMQQRRNLVFPPSKPYHIEK